MIIKAIYPTQLGGHIYYVGDTLDYAGEVTPRIAANFRDENGKPLVAGKAVATNATKATAKSESAAPKADDAEVLIRKTAVSFGREGLKAALDEAHISYSANATTLSLAKALLVHRGEVTP